MSVRISVCVTSLTVLGLLLLWLCIDRFATNTVQKDITNQM